MLNFFQLKTDDINSFVNNIFSSNYVFDDGKIDILTIITALGAFYLSKYYEDSLIILIISTIIVEVFVTYNNKTEDYLISALLIVSCFYLIKIFLRKNTYILEKKLQKYNVFDEISTQNMSLINYIKSIFI